MDDKCERCGLGFVKKDDNCDVCGVCLDEIELDYQYDAYVLDCEKKGQEPMPYNDWLMQTKKSNAHTIV